MTNHMKDGNVLFDLQPQCQIADKSLKFFFFFFAFHHRDLTFQLQLCSSVFYVLNHYDFL